MKIQSLTKPGNNWVPLLVRRISVILILSVFQPVIFGTTIDFKNDSIVNETHGNYPPALISYIRHQCQVFNSAERKSETYVEIDQLAYYENIQLIKNRIVKDSCRILAVLKSDAYGNGIEYLGKVAEYAGADYIGITENKEIIKLRS